MLSYDVFFGIYFFCLFGPFVLAAVHYVFRNKAIPKYYFLWLSSSYFILVNIVLKTFLLGFFRLFFWDSHLIFEHLIYNHIFKEYALLMFAIGLFGIVGLCSKSEFRVAPAILFGIFLILVSIAHWQQVEANIFLEKSRYYLLIIFDVLTAIILFYQSWCLKKHGLLAGSSSSSSSGELS